MENELTLHELIELGLSDDAYTSLRESMPDRLLKQMNAEGVLIMNISINGSYNNNSGNLTSFGSNVSQNQQLDKDFNEAFAVLIEAIAGLEEDQREQACYLAEQIKLAYQEKDVNKAEKPLKILSNILGVIGSLASIAGIFGVSI